mmetsp:Transcript_8279/g.18017  ORF Transcript_8279/g.18017 Transcript_8279/m.18017 type:complete len:90 (-) Transcript_8279:153-422(-)
MGRLSILPTFCITKLADPCVKYDESGGLKTCKNDLYTRFPVGVYQPTNARTPAFGEARRSGTYCCAVKYSTAYFCCVQTCHLQDGAQIR